MNQQESVEKTIVPKLLKGSSEYRELSQKSRSSGKDKGEERSGKIVQRTLSKCTYLQNSENRELSQNLRKKQAEEDIGNVKVTVSAEDN